MRTFFILSLFLTALARGDDGIQDPYGYVCGGVQDKTAEQLRERSQEIEMVYAAAAVAFARSRDAKNIGARELIERIEQEVKKAKERGLMPSPEALRTNWPKIPSLDTALDAYLDYLVIVEEAALKWVNMRRGFQGAQALDPNRVAELVSLAKTSLKVAIDEEPGWTSADRKAAIAEISPIEPITPSRVKAITEAVERHYLTLVYFLRCGPSGEYLNIFSKTPEAGMVNGRIIHGKPLMAVCPGMIMSLADQPDVLQTLKNMIAHEMAHGFDVSVRDGGSGFLAYDGQVFHRDFSKAYREFHKCLYANGYKDLGDPRNVISDYRAKANDSFFSEDERARYAFQAELLESKMLRVVSRVGREPTNLETHQEEIDADYWSFSELGQTVSDLPPEPARARVKQSLSYLCSTTDDGFRPSGKFRIGMAFQNRVIQAKTGYRPPPPPGHAGGGAGRPSTSCQMSGPVEIAGGSTSAPRQTKPTTQPRVHGGGSGKRDKGNGAAN